MSGRRQGSASRTDMNTADRSDFLPGLVSVVMPAYNAARYISQSIESVLNQVEVPFELIVVDDCSGDDTPAIVSRYASRDKRIRFFRNRMNLGAAPTRNRAIRESRGEFIAFLDADDVWYPDKLKRQVEVVVAQSAAMAFGSYDFIDTAGNIVGTWWAPPATSYQAMLGGNRIGCLTAIYRVASVGKVYMPEDVHQEDYVAWMKILKRGHVAVGLRDPLAAYRVGHASLSARKLRVIAWQWEAYRVGLGIDLATALVSLVRYSLHGILRMIRRRPVHIAALRSSWVASTRPEPSRSNNLR